MAALTLKQDQATGQLILEQPMWPRLVGVLGNLFWLLVLAFYFLMPSLTSGRINPESLIIFLILLIFSLGSNIRRFFPTTITIDARNRTLSQTIKVQLLQLPIRSTLLPFNDLANIEVQYYRQSSGRSSHEAYRVNAIDKSGKKTELNWDGKRDEMFALAQKISAMTSAPLLDQTEKPISTLNQILGRMRGSASSQSQETPSAPEPIVLTQEASETGFGEMLKNEQAATAAAGSTDLPEPDSTSIDEQAAMPAGQDLSGLGISELEQRVASDSMDSEARYTLARKYHARGQLDRAVELYQATLQIDTSNAEAQNDLGVAQQQRGKRTEAEAAYRRAIAFDPFSFNAHLNLALLLRSVNRAAEASQEFFQARQNVRGDEQTQLAESASSGARIETRLSKQ